MCIQFLLGVWTLSAGHPNWCLAAIGKEGTASSGCQWGRVIQIFKLIQAQMWFLHTVSAMTKPWHIPYIITTKPLHLRSRFLDWRLQWQYRQQMLVPWPIGCKGVFFNSCQEREMQEATQQVFNDFLERSLEVSPRLLQLRTLQIWVYQILRCEVWVEFFVVTKRAAISWKFRPLQEGGRKLKLFEETPEGWEQPIQNSGFSNFQKRPGREYLATRARSYRERWWERDSCDFPC